MPFDTVVTVEACKVAVSVTNCVLLIVAVVVTGSGTSVVVVVTAFGISVVVVVWVTRTVLFCVTVSGARVCVTRTVLF